MIFCRSSVKVFVRWMAVEDSEDLGRDPLVRTVFDSEDALVNEVVEERFKARGDLLLFLEILGTGGPIEELRAGNNASAAASTGESIELLDPSERSRLEALGVVA